ncbi:MAG TPA: DUF3465 domain-containing protein [Steroidobacteraceae bacterium]|jgi:uncharacterized protein DUF3465|nr:DUF3465 domain-containing protein [Steroidobacteraceae bacterium]
MKRIVVIAIAFVAAYFVMQSGLIPREHDAGSSTGTTAGNSNQALVAAFENHRSNVQVQGSGHVTKVLADDNDGSRHQRFIVRVDSGQTVLIAHNIDLANRVASLSNGDRIEFYGEYEWNAKGGVIHWTHRDPQHRHVDGWIKHNGRTYQ